ncbi:hypothetical protein ACFRCI_17130 [Streptomyces sp. NPDC056638]|uniref:hypothetical protein n=1 Tax=Streptomyces sp. NPDC056638 TaxID=3345887 RepID=UPI0036960C06
MIPNLPEGQFLRVRQDAFIGFVVELRQKRKRFGSKLLETVYVDPSRHESGAAAFHAAVKRIHEKQAERRRICVADQEFINLTKDMK